MGLANDDARTPVASTALVASAIVLAAPGRLRSILVLIDSTAPTDVYYPQLFDAATLPSEAAATNARVLPGEVNHTSGDYGDGWTWDFGPSGIQMSAGAVVVLSTARFTKTIAGSYMTVQAVTG